MTRPPDDDAPATSRFARRGGFFGLHFETVGSISAIVIGVAALLVSLDQGRVMREEIRASLWPVLQVDGYVDASPEQVAIGLRVENAGVGPAIVQRVSIWHEGELLADLDAVADVMEGARDRSQETLTGRVIAAGATAAPFTFRFPPSAQLDAVDLMNDIANDWRIEVCYCSALGQCWLSDPRVSPPADINRCDAAPASDL